MKPNHSPTISRPGSPLGRLKPRAVCTGTFLLLFATALAQSPLEIYDGIVASDAALGTNPQVPVATLTSPVTLTGTAGSAFDFGATTGDATIEFILEGDPSASVSSFLAVGASTPASRLVFESWPNSGQLGFTQGGVADYVFSPGIPSPTEPTHLAYVWDPTAKVMKVYVNGALAGSTPDVSSAFVMPTGAGWLGAANATGDEGMRGTIHRVTVYDNVVPDAVIKRHASAFGAHVSKALAAYDAAVTTDAGAGLAPTAKQASAVVLNGSGGVEFDFGTNSDDVTMEFILEGDPDFDNGAFLAVGENGTSSLRYEVWGLPNQLGFTQIRVADYNFSPSAASPTLPTHVTYAWNAGSHTMQVFVNGVLSGTSENIHTEFAMPFGLGRLGSNLENAERMVGTIYRLTTYDTLLEPAAILRHAKAFADLLSPPTIVAFGVTPTAIGPGQTATLNWEVKNATKVLVNGVQQAGVTQLDVSSPISTTYTLVAENALGKVNRTVRLQVNPDLTGYDAAIMADAAGGLNPVTKLTTQVAATGDWAGIPFNFGATSGDTTMEFIVEGDPTTGAGTAIATDYDEGTSVWRHSLRFSQWDADGRYGFTKRAVADYAFDPPVPTASWPTHVTYVWDAAAAVVSIYVNGTLASTRADVSTEFAMPTGQGTLGEGMVGTIFRVTVYSGKLPEQKILSHGRAFLDKARPSLSAYDKAIDASSTAGTAPTARLFAPVTLPGDRGIVFSFGAVADDGTVEFIMDGKPGASVSSFLAVGADAPVSRLVFESWPDTVQLGFTQGGVADYLFTPAVASPTTPTHVAFAWDPAKTTMMIYVNGVLAGTTTGVDPAFILPSGLGRLGDNVGGGEPMTGTIHRVTVYDTLLSEAVLSDHARAFVGVTKPPVLALEVVAKSPVVVLSDGVAGAHYRVEFRNGLSGDWELLEDISGLSGTSARINDPTPVSQQSERYYRAVLVP